MRATRRRAAAVAAAEGVENSVVEASVAASVALIATTVEDTTRTTEVAVDAENLAAEIHLAAATRPKASLMAKRASRPRNNVVTGASCTVTRRLSEITSPTTDTRPLLLLTGRFPTNLLFPFHPNLNLPVTPTASPPHSAP